LPTNYKRLCQEIIDESEEKAPTPQQPALASLPGIAYPGPALLGDARALMGCLLQRQIYECGAPERTGWILFGGDSLRQGESIEVAVDLGGGLKTYRLSFPKR
jgi:hypothetical protein